MSSPNAQVVLKMPYRLELPCSEIGRVGEKEVDFLDSSFFTTKPGHRSLPTPAEVIARSPKFHTHPSPPPVRFEHLDLIVKCGPYVVVEEALCLRMLQKTFAKKVPVPEVYGWRVEGRDVFIYMELIRGETLQDRWDHLTDQERSSICGQLKEIVSTFRKVEQDPTDPFIGMSIFVKPLTNGLPEILSIPFLTQCKNEMQETLLTCYFTDT